MKATVTCPKCGVKTELEMPVNGCLPFYKCSGCGEMISAPADGKTCCVICAYSDTKCPVSTVK